VSLFTERARTSTPGFELTDANAEAVAEICRRLDGLPLAIELAAPRVRLLPPQDLASRLDQRFSLLTGGARDLPARQRTLKNTLDWSFGLLSAGEQALFARLGVFAGEFSLPAAEAVGVGSPDEGQAEGAGPVMDTLGSLVDSCLIRLETGGGEPRFSLLETIREYALGRLREGGDWVDAHDRHAAYFLALAEPSGADLAGPGQLAWLDRLQAEHDNLAAALSWLGSTGQPGKAVHMIWAAWRFWWLRGHIEELLQFTDKVLASSQDMTAHERALTLSGVGFNRFLGGDQTAAEMMFEQSLPLFEQAGDRLGGALAAAALGHLLAGRQEYQRARDLLEQIRRRLDQPGTGTLTGAERVQSLLVLALTENFLGQVELGSGHQDRAARHFASGLRAARSAPDRFTILVSLYDLALSKQAQGDLPGAAGHLKEGLALAANAGDETSAAYYLEVLAAVAGQQDNPQRAVRLLAAARSILEASGSGWLYIYVPRALYDDAALPALRSRMSDAAFEEAQAWGGSTESRQVVEYALK
jgi:predicted ATPase